MLKDLICGKQVYVVTGYTDLRKSIDGLAAIVQGQLELDVFSSVAGNVTVSKDCCGKVMDFFCCTKDLITGNFNGLAMKRKQGF